MLTLADVTVTYTNGVTASQPTSLSFEKGRFVALIEPSGAGKSTLLRCLNGLARPTHGDVLANVDLFKEMKLIVPAGTPEEAPAARFAAYASRTSR